MVPRPLASAARMVRRAPGYAFAGLVVAGLSGWTVVSDALGRPADQWLVDLEVYREAGLSVLVGRPVYDWVTPAPQLLPFTYPPIAALFAVPLGLVPFRPLGVAWSVGQLLILAGVVAVAWRELIARVPPRARPLVLGLLVGGLVWLLPVRDTVRFGQVNLILVALVLADYVALRRPTWPHWPRGMLVGVATAVKLTPGVFVVHLWLSGHRREAATATATAAVLTLLPFLLIPYDAGGYWFDAFFDSDRLGPNTGTTNQSVRGLMLHYTGGEAPLWAWLPLVAVVAVIGFRYAVRASHLGDEVAAVAIVGLLAVLLSPVAWVHHLSWLVVALAVVAGPGTSRARWALAGALLVFYALRIPWWGANMYWDGDVPGWLARTIQNSYGLVALALLPVLDLLVRKDAADRAARGSTDARPGVASGLAGR